MPTWLYFNRASNMAMHDLTLSKKPPPNLRCLLGLNLKFIPRRRFTTSDLTDTHTRFKQQIYLQDYYLRNPVDNDTNDQTTYNPKLHIRTHWMPAVWKVSQNTVHRTDTSTTLCKTISMIERRTSSSQKMQQRLI